MPVEIDGARVIKVTKFGDYGIVDYDSGEEKEIKNLAICSYGTGHEYYLFACDEDFNVLGDTLHNSIEEAMQTALQLYEKECIEWL